MNIEQSPADNKSKIPERAMEPFADGIDVMLTPDELHKAGAVKLSMDEVVAIAQEDAVPADEVMKLLDEIEHLKGENVYLKQQVEEALMRSGELFELLLDCWRVIGVGFRRIYSKYSTHITG